MIEFSIVKFFTIVGGVYSLGIITPMALIYVVIRREDMGRKRRRKERAPK